MYNVRNFYGNVNWVNIFCRKFVPYYNVRVAELAQYYTRYVYMYESPFAACTTFNYCIIIMYYCYAVGVDKKTSSEKLVLRLLNEFLFPASILSKETAELCPSGIINITAK